MYKMTSKSTKILYKMFQHSDCDFRRRRLVGCDLRNHADKTQEIKETECFALLLVISASNK